MAILTTINGIPLYDSPQEALAWGSQYNLQVLMEEVVLVAVEVVAVEVQVVEAVDINKIKLC